MNTMINDNPTKPENSKAFGNLEITRMAPGDQRITIDFSWAGSFKRNELILKVLIKDYKTLNEVYTAVIDEDAEYITINDLRNGTDYLVELEARCRHSGAAAALSHPRLFRTGFVPGTVINYIHPEDYTYNSSGRSPASPSIVRLQDGSLLASHDIFWGEGGQNLTKVFVSRDNGNTWEYLSDIYPCFWGKLFLHKNILYMLGTSTEYGALLIFKSMNLGKTWSKPAHIMDGGSRDEGGPHKAPMPVVNHNGRLWTAIDYGSWSTGGHASGVISIDADQDLMDPENWIATPFLPYSSEWEGTIRGGNPGLLEGNVVVTPEGGLVNILRYHTAGGSPDYGKAVILNIDKDRPGSMLTFGRVIDFPGNMSKFTIQYDKVSKKYYSLVNRVTTDWVSQRNILTLISSHNLFDWKIERDLLNYEDNGWPEDYTKVGFQYVDWIFDGNDIAAVCRTAVNGAYNFHNANHLTFHRFKNFRR